MTNRMNGYCTLHCGLLDAPVQGRQVGQAGLATLDLDRVCKDGSQRRDSERGWILIQGLDLACTKAGGAECEECGFEHCRSAQCCP